MSDNILSFAKQVGEDIADIFKRFRPSKERVLDADEDLNTLLDRGVYNATFNMVDWQAQNYPGNLKGYVVVEKMETVNYITQYFYSRSNLGVPYIAYRFMVTAGWSPWVQIQPDPPSYSPPDTGWRDVSADLGSAWTIAPDGHIRLRRLDDFVYLSVKGLSSVSGATGNLAALPVGFRPIENNTAVNWADDGTQPGRYSTASTWFVRIWNIEAGAVTDPGITNVLSFPAAPTPPTTLPGTPV